jgi:glycosyltransferase 2 family protein
LTHLPDWLKTSVKLLLTGLALYLVFQQVDIDQLQDLSQSLHWPWIAGAFFLFVWSKVATAIRLNHYFNNLGIHLSAWENWKLYLIGMFYNLFLPGGIGGDGYKVYLLHQDHKTPLKQLIKASLLDRLSGLVSILVVLAVLFLWVEVPIPFTKTPFWFFLCLGLIPTCLVAFWGIQHYFFTDFIPSFWPSMTWSLVGQVAQMACVYFLLLGLGIDQDLLAYQVIFLVSSLVAVLPLTIGGVGARELVMVYAHAYAGVEEAPAVAFSLLFFLISASVSLVGAVIKRKAAKT